MQSVSSRIWTRVAVSISYDDNDYTTDTLSIDYRSYESQTCPIKWNAVFFLSSGRVDIAL